MSPLVPWQPCWREYLTTRIEQNMVVNCTCPISECRAQPTTAFIYSILSSQETIAKVKQEGWLLAVQALSCFGQHYQITLLLFFPFLLPRLAA